MKRNIGLVIVACGALAILIYIFRSPIADWLKPSGAAGSTAAAEGRAGQDTALHSAGPSALTKEGERKILYWYDAMNPAYRSDKPGKAPDGMELVPRYADEVEAMKDMPAGTVMISPEKQQLIGVRTAPAERQRVQRSIRAVGRVAFDETRISHIHTKVTGYIEEAFVDFVGKTVRKGDPLFTIYSPELVSTQQEYLIALRGKKYLSEAPFREVSDGAESLLRAARERLRLWDVTDDEIQVLEREGKVKRTLTMYSPASGVVTERAVFQHGRYVNPEMDLYTIVDLSTAWVLADVYEYELPYVRVGQIATMRLSYYPEKRYIGKITFINPTVDPKTRTAKARLEFPNADFALKPEMFAEVELTVDYGLHVVAPQEAVLDAGSEQIVFLAHPDGHFEPRRIQVGPRVDDRVIVLSGLQPGEMIVTSANFLIDSESRLKSAMGGMKH
jgi:multidrug efflux pump subunit AcrA (membrane-fusion protein)